MSTNSSDVFSKDFIKTVVGYLTTSCKDGTALTRPELAKFIRKEYGRTLDKTALNMWLSASVNMGLFNSDDVHFKCKRGVGGGIVMVSPKARKAPVKKAAPRKTRAPKVEVATPAPTQEPSAESTAPETPAQQA